MKLKLLVAIAVFTGCLSTYAQNTLSNNYTKKKSSLRVIDSNDSVFFNLSAATYTSTYVDIPVYIKSNDVINALDFSFKFNELRLTYDSILNFKSYLFALSNFNQVDRFLRFTSSSLQVIEQNTKLVSIRFLIASPCMMVTAADFNSITVYLNGDPCSYRFTTPIQNAPVANFNNNKICQGTSVTFNNTSTFPGGTITSWAWNFGNGNTSSQQNPTYTYSTTGSYNVTLIVSSNTGCKDTIVKPVTVNVNPVSNFTSQFICAQDSVFFTNTSIISSGSIASYLWNFGDGGNSILQNPAHNYNAGGSYIVSLTSTSDSGCTNIFIDTIVLNKPTSNFVSTTGCAGSSIAFTDSSTYSSGTITAWQWYFGDGGTSSLQNPNHTYTNGGTYIVSLVVNPGSSCSDSVFKTIIIDNMPIIKFGANNLSGCNPLTVGFTDSSITSIGSTFLWKFGDNTTSTSQNPIHIYNSSGAFNVKLIVTSAGGCIDSLEKIAYINVFPKPVANFGSGGGCSGIAISFNDSTTISSGTITAWNWDFGNGSLSTLQNPFNTYNTPGVYTITLIVTSNQGCKDTISKLLTITTKPIVKFGANNLTGCVPLTVQFSDSSITAVGSTYLWNFGDNTTSSSQNPTHTYNSTGVFTVKLYVTAPGGCIDSLIKPAYINAYSGVTANFGYSSNLCSGTILNFTDSSVISTGTITSWNWNFGNGNSSSLQNPTPVYSSSGTYTVILIVTSNQGCTDTISKTIVIDTKPIAKFSADTTAGCAPLLVNFSDSSITSIGSSYFWSFGDGNTANTQNTNNTYLNTGLYSVKLIVTTPGGCIDSLTKTNYITIHSVPTALFTATPDTAMIPNALISFTNQSTNSVSQIWNFGDGNFTSLNNPSHTYDNVGAYEVCITATNSFGCTSTYCDTVYVIAPNPAAIPSAFTPNGDNSNDELKVRGGPYIEFEFKIYNEWGNLIFSSDKQEQGWDGTFKGTQQPVGLYEYTFKGKNADNKTYSLYGVVNLIR